MRGLTEMEPAYAHARDKAKRRLRWTRWAAARSRKYRQRIASGIAFWGGWARKARLEMKARRQAIEEQDLTEYARSMP